MGQVVHSDGTIVPKGRKRLGLQPFVNQELAQKRKRLRFAANLRYVFWGVSLCFLYNELMALGVRADILSIMNQIPKNTSLCFLNHEHKSSISRAYALNLKHSASRGKTLEPMRSNTRPRDPESSSVFSFDSIMRDFSISQKHLSHSAKCLSHS